MYVRRNTLSNEDRLKRRSNKRNDTGQRLTFSALLVRRARHWSAFVWNEGQGTSPHLAPILRQSEASESKSPFLGAEGRLCEDSVKTLNGVDIGVRVRYIVR